MILSLPANNALRRRLMALALLFALVGRIVGFGGAEEHTNTATNRSKTGSNLPVVVTSPEDLLTVFPEGMLR
jgi:hypothetical protein